MKCDFCDGQCACHISAPCGFCEAHVICEICDRLVCNDKVVEVTDKFNGYKMLVCPDCAEKYSKE